MPRPNQPRSIASEESLARRVAYEREARNMTYEGLALRMTKVGCPIQASGLYKIEKAGRRITVDELVGLARVFEVPVDRLLLPPELAAADELTDLVVTWNQAQDKAIAAKQQEDEAWEGVRDWVERHPEYAEKVEPVMRKWSEIYFEDDDLGHDFRAAHKMWELTQDPAWGERSKGLLDALVEKKRGE